MSRGHRAENHPRGTSRAGATSSAAAPHVRRGHPGSCTHEHETSAGLPSACGDQPEKATKPRMGDAHWPQTHDRDAAVLSFSYGHRVQNPERQLALTTGASATQ